MIIMENNEQNMKKDNIQGSTALPPGFSVTQTFEGGTSPLRSFFQGKWIAWIVLLASLAVTFFAWYFARGVTQERANDRFVFRSQAIESTLLDRLHDYAFLLHSGAGLFAGSEEVTRAEWRTYVTALQIYKHYPGIQGLGFAKMILPAEKQAHIRQLRAEGFPNYDILPEGKRPVYTSIIFLEPFDWRNQRAFGYDMFSESTRKAAMVRARDTGSTAMSGKVTLLQETAKDVQAGFLIYLPVYRKGEVPKTPELRREALTGYVYSPFRMNDFMQGLLLKKREYVELQIFDGDEPRKADLLYPSGDKKSLSDHAHFASYQSILEFAGRRWLLVFKSTPYFEKTIDTGQVNSILLLGSIISLLLFFVVLSLTKSHSQALSLANVTLDLEKANFGLRQEVVERKQGEEKIRQLNDELEKNVQTRTHQLVESQALLSTVFDSVKDGIVLANAETRRFRMSNTSFQRMLGYSADAILELGVADIHPQEEMDTVNRQVEQNIKREISFVPNVPVKRKDGSIFYADINTSVMMVNETSFLLAVFTDITDRKQTVLALRQSEQFLDTLLNAIPVPVFYKDREGRYLGFNKAYETFFGATRDQLIGKSVFDLSPPELAKIYHAKDTELFVSREMQQYESQVKDSHGSLHDVIFSKAVFNDSQGVVNGLIGAILDISERKRAQQALAGSEALLRGVFDSVQDGIVVVDVQTQQYRMVNTAMCRMLGYSREEWLTMCVQDTHPREALPRIAREFESLAKGDSTLAPALPVKRKDGSIFYADVNAGPMTINGVASVVGVFRDITERKQAEEEILKLNQALEEKVRQLLATQEELEQHRAHLEQEVAQRTASLTEAQRIAHLGNWEWDVINNTVNWSDEMYRIFGLRAAADRRELRGFPERGASGRPSVGGRHRARCFGAAAHIQYRAPHPAAGRHATLCAWAGRSDAGR